MLSVSLDVSAVPERPAGAGRYTLDLVRRLGTRDDVELTLVARTYDAGRWAGVAPRASVLAAAPGPRPARLVWEQVALPGVLARQEPAPAVHHGPHYTMPERARLPRVVTVHDLTFFDHPEWHERSKVWFFRRAIRVAARRADAVVCVSAASAARLRELTGPRAEVFTVPHGVDHSRFRPYGAAGPGVVGGAEVVGGPAGGGDAEPDAEAEREALAARGVRPPYVAFLGTVEPRKGLDVLLRAFDAVAGSHPDVQLVVAGGAGWGTGPVDAELGRMRHAGRVTRTGYLPEELLPAFLRAAAVVAYPSRAEGFGLPVLEALACGARVVTTAGSAMQEISEHAAVLVPPGDSRALAEALETELGDAGRGAAPRRRAGLEVAAAYTWERCAEDHVAVYRHVT